MKEYKYKINGNLYKVTIGNVEGQHCRCGSERHPLQSRNGESAATQTGRSKTGRTPAGHYPRRTDHTSVQTGRRSQQVGREIPAAGRHPGNQVNVGDAVKKGQTVVILEAMKMENSINADKDGKVTAINVKPGDSVLEGTDLVIIE